MEEVRVRENDFNLNIPRYVDTHQEEAPVELPAVQAEIEALERELQEVRKQINGHLKELGLK